MSENRFDQIIELHDEISKRYKEFETTTGNLPPVVILNELRYALRALVRILKLSPIDPDLNEEKKEMLIKHFRKRCMDYAMHTMIC